MTSRKRELTPEQSSIVFILMMVFLVVIALLVIWCQRAVKKLFQPRDTQFYSAQWNKIRQLYDVDDTRSLAIVHANSLLDDALKKQKYSGETMYQRLVSAQRRFTNKNQVQNAYRLSNQISHDGNMKPLPEPDMRQALQAFRQALLDLGAL